MNYPLLFIPELFLQSVHLLFQLAHAEVAETMFTKWEAGVAMTPRAEIRTLRHFFFCKRHPNFFFFAFTQERECHSGSF